MSSINKTMERCLLSITAIFLTGALIYTKTILMPFVISLFIYAVITPCIKYFQVKMKISRIPSLLLASSLFLVFFFAVGFFLVTSFNSFLEGTHIYQDKLIQVIDELNSLALTLDIRFDFQSIRNELRNLPVFSFIRQFSGGILGFITHTLLVMVFCLFLIVGDTTHIKRPMWLSDIEEKISRYVATKLLTSILTGIGVGIVYFSFGLDLAFTFAVVAIMLNFIPTVGSLFSVFLPLPLILLQFGSGVDAFLIILLTVFIHLFIGNVLEPKLMGESMDLHPITILIFLMFWGLVWGIPGMFLAVPITAIIKIVLSKVESLEFFSELMAGRFKS